MVKYWAKKRGVSTPAVSALPASAAGLARSPRTQAAADRLPARHPLWHGTLRGSARVTPHSTFGARERIPGEKGGADGHKEQYSLARSDIAQKLKSTPGSQSLPCHGRGCAPTIPQLAGAAATCSSPRRAALLTVATQASTVAVIQRQTYSATRMALWRCRVRRHSR